MFNGATTFSQDISEWDISNCDISGMFNNCPLAWGESAQAIGQDISAAWGPLGKGYTSTALRFARLGPL